MAVKGKTNNPNGRPKGIPNKSTQKFREALNNLLEQSSEQMINWLGEIENPKDRFTVIKDLAEYIHPKLSRVDKQLLDKDGEPADSNKIEVSFVSSTNTDTK